MAGGSVSIYTAFRQKLCQQTSNIFPSISADIFVQCELFFAVYKSFFVSLIIVTLTKIGSLRICKTDMVLYAHRSHQCGKRAINHMHNEGILPSNASFFYIISNTSTYKCCLLYYKSS